MTALKSGQLDGVEVPVPPTSVAALKAAHFLVRSSPGDSFDDFIINSNPQQQASHRELLNPLLRQAFDHAIDRQAIVATSLLGHGQPGSTIIPPATGSWSDPAIKPAQFSLATANQLLDNAEEIFQSGAKTSSAEHEALQAQLYEQIGRLKTELDWLKKKAASFG